MRLPEILQTNDRITMIDTFLGLDKNSKVQENEFADMKNITNDYFPALGNRKRRGIISRFDDLRGLLGGNVLSYVDDDKFYYDEGYVCDLEESGERQMVSLGAYIVIFPDGVIYNTQTREIDYIENETEATTPTMTLCRIDGSPYDAVSGTTAPQDTTKYWIDTSSNPVVLKMYSSNTSSWVSVGTTYVKFSATGIGVGFKAYDAATFSGVDKDSPDIYNNWDFNQSNIIFACDDDYVIVAGLINSTHVNSTNVTVKRMLPQMDYVCELNNRIYGCSSANHEIYACKLGDPKNWYCYAGLDSDSYAATVGTQDEFTGAVAYRGYVFFFKDSGYHQLYGTKPSNFQISWNPGRGVQIGSSKSIRVVNNYLMFKSREGVCLFDGSTQLVSQKLGAESYYDAVAGSYRNKYYVSMRDDEDVQRLFVYDTSKGTWCIEDDMFVTFAASTTQALYLVDDTNTLYMVNEEDMYAKLYPREDLYPEEDLYPGASISGDREDNFEWMIETGDIGTDSPFQKYLKRVDIRLLLADNARMRIEAEYDSTGDWRAMYDYYCTKKRSYSVPIHVQRCDHVRLRFSGFGDFRIFSIAKVIEEGSDV